MGTVTSVGSGNYNTGSTWDSGARPGSSDDVVIASGHTVTLVQAENANSLDLQSGGTLDGDGNLLTIDGEDGNGYAVNLDGAISGTDTDFAITTAATTAVDFNPTSGAVRDLTINNGGNTITLTDPMTLSRNLTITAGELDTASDRALTVTGAIDVASGGALTCNSSAVQCNGLRTTGGTVNLPDASGSFTVKGTEFSGYGIYDRVGSGNIVHNGGTVTWDIGGMSTMYALSTFNNITTTTSGTTLRWFSALTLAGDLTVAANTTVYEHSSAGGAFTVGGDVDVSGTLGDSNAYSAYSFGSLKIVSGGTYNATSGTTTITDQAGSGYAFRELGTFTHNNGTMKFTDTGSHPYVQGSSFYNLEVALAASTLEFRWEDSGGSLVTIDNDLTITRGRFKFNTAGDSITVHGLTKLESDGQFGLGSPSGTHAFNGLVTLNGGTWYLSSGTNNMAGIRNVGGTIQ